jgi:outer membrane protein assembly factor BamB/predicted phosphodiesterase
VFDASTDETMGTFPFRLSACALLIAASASYANAQGIRFAWLTDTHVGTSTGEEDLRASVRDLNSQSDLQFVLLTGDITEFGSDVELTSAREILDSLRHPYHIIPGNHDTKWSESGGRTFGHLFGADRYLFRAGGILFIGLHQGPWMRMADGFWAPEDLRWLDSALAEQRDLDEPMIFTTHYPLDSGIANWYEVLDRLKGRNVQAVLVGHGHLNLVQQYEGIPGVMGRSNLRGRDSSGGYTIVWSGGDSLIFAERDPRSGTLSRWHALVMHQKHVPPAEREWPRPSYAVNEAYPRAREIWTYDSRFTIAAPGGLEGGRFIFGASDGVVTALEATTGQRVWQRRTGGPIYSAPAASGGIAVIGSTDSTIRAYRITDGEEIWSIRTGGAVLGVPAIDGGRVYIGGSDRMIRGIDLNTGKILWTFSGCSGFIEARPLCYRGNVYVGAWDGGLYALEGASGRLLWKWEGRGTLFSPAACWPVGAAEKVFIVAPDRNMTALEARTGNVVWRSGAHQVRETIGGSADSERVFVRLLRDTIMAFSAAAPAPHPLWATSVGFGYDINAAMIVEKDGTVFYGTKDGEVIALESQSGRLLWRHRATVGALNTLTPLSRSEVIGTGVDGKVRMIKGE